MRDQADQLRHLVRQAVKTHPALEPGCPLVVVSGGRRGVGTSTLAIDLAKEISGLGRSTVLVDGNLLRPDLAAILGIDPSDGLAEVLAGHRSAVEVLEPVAELMALLPGRPMADSLPELDHHAMKRLLSEIRSLGSRGDTPVADMAIVDAGSGMSPWVQRLWQSAEQILLVTADDPSAIKESYAALKLAPWGDIDGKLRLVVNLATDLATAQQVSARISATCRQFLGVKLSEPAAVVQQADTEMIAQTEFHSTDANFAYRQSMRLLAADVVNGWVSATSQRMKRMSPKEKLDRTATLAAR